MRRVSQLLFGILAPAAALIPAFGSLWQIGLSGLRQPTIRGILTGWGVLLIMVFGWQAISVLVIVVLAGNDALKHLRNLRLFAIISLLSGLFVATAVLIAASAYGQCAYVLQDLSGSGSYFYALTLAALMVLAAFIFERLWSMLRFSLKKKR